MTKPHTTPEELKCSKTMLTSIILLMKEHLDAHRIKPKRQAVVLAAVLGALVAEGDTHAPGFTPAFDMVRAALRIGDLPQQ